MHATTADSTCALENVRVERRRRRRLSEWVRHWLSDWWRGWWRRRWWGAEEKMDHWEAEMCFKMRRERETKWANSSASHFSAQLTFSESVFVRTTLVAGVKLPRGPRQRNSSEKADVIRKPLFCWCGGRGGFPFHIVVSKWVRTEYMAAAFLKRLLHNEKGHHYISSIGPGLNQRTIRPLQKRFKEPNFLWWLHLGSSSFSSSKYSRDAFADTAACLQMAAFATMRARYLRASFSQNCTSSSHSSAFFKLPGISISVVRYDVLYWNVK